MNWIDIKLFEIKGSELIWIKISWIKLYQIELTMKWINLILVMFDLIKLNWIISRLSGFNLVQFNQMNESKIKKITLNRN